MNDAHRAFRLFLNGLPWAIIIGFLLGLLSGVTEYEQSRAYAIPPSNTTVQSAASVVSPASTVSLKPWQKKAASTSALPAKSTSGFSVTPSSIAALLTDSPASGSNGGMNRCDKLEQAWWRLSAQGKDNAADSAYWKWVEC